MKIMRQQGDHSFTEILNRIRYGQLTKDDKENLCTRIMKKSDDNYPYDALHIWAENEPVDKYNESKLEMIKRPLLSLLHMTNILQWLLSMMYRKLLPGTGVKLEALTIELSSSKMLE